MLNTNSSNSFIDINNIVHHVKSIIITTDIGDIVISSCLDPYISFTQTITENSSYGFEEKKITIETQFKNLTIIK